MTLKGSRKEFSVIPYPSNISIFSDVRRTFCCFENKKVYALITTFPFYLLLMLYWFVSPHVLNSSSIPIVKDTDISILVLTIAGINAVLITSVGLLYKEIIIEIEDIGEIKNSVNKIMEEIEKDKYKYDQKFTFIDGSIHDLKKLLEIPNRGIRYLHNNLYGVELFLVFCCSTWAVLNFLSDRGNGFGILFCSFLVIYLLLHGIILLLQHFMRSKIRGCLDELKIKSKWELFQRETQSLAPDTVKKEIDTLINRIGI